MSMIIKTYSEMIALPAFIERYRYLRLGGRVGEETFGFDRWLNQKLYKDLDWMRARDKAIIRDNGCDLGMEGHEIHGRIYVHHINPITKEDILRRDPCLFDPDNLICTSKNTHDAIHFSNESLLIIAPTIRTPNDTCPWKH